MQLAPRKKRFVIPRLWRGSRVALTAVAAALMFTLLSKPKAPAPIDPHGGVIVVENLPTPPASLTSLAVDQGASRVGVDESEYVYNQTRVAYQVGFALPEEGRR